MSIDEFAIDFERDGSLDLYYAMFGAGIKDILVNGIPIDDVDYPYCSNVTIVLDNGYEVYFETGHIDSRDVADFVTYGEQPPMTVDLLDAQRAIGRRINAVWVDSLTTLFEDGEVGTNKTFRLFVEYMHLPMDIFKTASIKNNADGPSINVQIRR